MACAICGMVHIKEPLLLIEKSSRSSGGSGFPLSLSEWSFIICTTAYNYKNVLSASLNKTFPSFLRYFIRIWQKKTALCPVIMEELWIMTFVSANVLMAGLEKPVVSVCSTRYSVV